MRRLSKTERIILAATASAAATVIVKGVKLLRSGKDYLIRKSAGDLTVDSTAVDVTETIAEEKNKKTVDTNVEQ